MPKQYFIEDKCGNYMTMRTIKTPKQLKQLAQMLQLVDWLAGRKWYTQRGITAGVK